MSNNTALSSTGRGAFTISLDFELMWGVFDSRSRDEYGANILGTRNAINGMLERFERYDIGVTWAAVGLLFCSDKAEMLERLQLSGLAHERPDLLNYIERQVGQDVQDDPCHFGTDILQQLRNSKRQEIGSHSFAHYGLLEPYATLEGFAADTRAVVELFKDRQIALNSYVFARNQVDPAGMATLADTGMRSFRGCPKQRLYLARSPADNNFWLRMARFLDSCMPLTNLAVTRLNSDSGMLDTVATRFLRPVGRSRLFIRAQEKRLKHEMTYAAQTGRFYHLWWHPHNFGVHTETNLQTLERLLVHYRELDEQYGWPSMNMAELASAQAQLGG
ncbi:MAG: hypothetical protein RLN96_10095 [Pseudomonadales bacterium]